MEFTQSDILEVAENVWTTMLGLEIQQRSVPADTSSGRSLSASVELMGDWRGWVAVRCPEPLARKVASSMLARPEMSASDDDIFDAMGEVANMTAGNLKGFLGGECRLTPPTVTCGYETSLGIDRQIVMATSFDCGSDAFSVILVEYTPN